MRNKNKIFVFTLFFLIILIPTISADTIYLKNGRKMEGLIKKERDGNVWLDVGFGAVKFRKQEIERIERSKSDEVRQIRKEWQRQKKLEEERWQQREKDIEEARRREELEPKEIGISKDTDQIVVDVLLNDKVKASLLLDTGASMVLLASRKAEELGIEDQVRVGQSIEVQVADGRKVDAKHVVLERVDVQGAIARDVDAVVLSDDSEMDIHDGLLGMSFLKRFNFQIDNANKKLTLEKRE